jgi:PAS domain S-box-containing protein
MIRSIAKFMSDLPFGRKILLYGMAVSLISLTLVTIGIVTYDAIASRQVFAERIVTRADMLAQLCGSSLVFNDQAFASKALNALREKHDVRAACLYGSDGSVFASFSKAGDAAVFPKIPAALSQAFHDGHVEVFRPVLFSGEQVGTIYMRCRNDELAGRFGGNVPIIAGVFLISLAAALLLCRRVQRVMSQPISELERVAKAVSLSEDYAERAVKFGDDELGGLTDTFNSMLARIHASDAVLRESEMRYRTIFESAAEGILIADIETKSFLYANPAFCRMLGYTPEEILQLTVQDLHPAETLGSVLAAFEAQACGKKILAPDIPCQRKDGTVFHADINAAAVPIGGKACNVGFFTDTTESKRAERELANHRNHLEEMVRDKTSELRAIVNAMAGRETRMAELKEEMAGLRSQLIAAGIDPLASQPKENGNR